MYYARSFVKDTARSEERTIVATNDPADRGVYNNWHPAATMRPLLEEQMRGASRGKTMYVVPYLMAPPGSALEAYAAGVELTDHRTVALHMIRMARVGVEYVDNLADPDSFVRAVHVTGDLEKLGQGTDDDQRHFVTFADERTILHFGSSYGGNALLGKIAHGLRQAAYDGWTSGRFLAEQFMLLGIHDKQTGRTFHICGGFPSASGKTNLAMMLAPGRLGDRYHVEFYGDDIAWLRVDPDDGKIYAINPEYGVFGVAKDTNANTNPTALESVQAGTGALFTNVAYNEISHDVWWEGKTPDPPTDTTGWRDWTGQLISERPTAPSRPVGTPQQPIHHHSGQHPEHRHRRRRPPRRPDRRHHLRWPDPRPRATDPSHHRPRRRRLRRPHPRRRGNLRRRRRRRAAALRPDVDATLHVLPRRRLRRALAQDPRLSHRPTDLRPRQLVPTRPRRRALPLAGLPRQPPTTAMAAPAPRRHRDRNQTPVGILPTPDELDLDGVDVTPTDLDRLLTIDIERWRQEIAHRDKHLAQFTDLPDEIWQAHERVAAALALDPGHGEGPPAR